MIEEDLDKDAEETVDGGPDFNYILSMPLWNLTREKKDELCKKRDAKSEELSKLRKKSSTDLWRDDLEEFLAELDVRMKLLARFTNPFFLVATTALSCQRL